MGKQITWNDQAKIQLRLIDKMIAMRILQALARYAATGEADVKRLQGIDPPELRLRVGDYRLRFHDFGNGIEVTGVRHRRDAYR